MSHDFSAVQQRNQLQQYKTKQTHFLYKAGLNMKNQELVNEV